MPHPGTHISVVQLLAAETPAGHVSLTNALGGTSPEPLQNQVTADMALRNRYACLGAVGPDMLYFLLDVSYDVQKLQDYVVKYFAITRSFEQMSDTVSEIWEQTLGTAAAADYCGFIQAIDQQGGNIADTLAMAQGLLSSLAEELTVNGTGFNFFSLFKSPRQEGLSPLKWWWADHLHYAHTGDFTHALLTRAFMDPNFTDPDLQAYALGYLTHYVTDTIGHPYVNQIVGGPYRLHRQRHTLVENFIDGWLWPRTHKKHVDAQTINGDKNPQTGRFWLDEVVAGQAACGTPSDSHYYTCRIDELLDVGSGSGFVPPLENLLANFATEFQSGANAVFNIDGVGVKNDAQFSKFADFFIACLTDVYKPDPLHPNNLAPEDLPSHDDIAAAYATCLTVMRMQTKSTIKEPEFPDLSNASPALQTWIDGFQNQVSAALTSIQNPNASGSVSLSSLLDWVQSVLAAVGKVVQAVVSALGALCQAGTAMISGSLDVLFYYLQKALWAGYTSVHSALEVRAYAQPLPDTVDQHAALFTYRPNSALRGEYPTMEVRSNNVIQQDQYFTSLDPVSDPVANAALHHENPTINLVGPEFNLVPTGTTPGAGTPLDLLYQPIHDVTGPNGTIPVMFTTAGPITFATQPDTEVARNFGGIIWNCRWILEQIVGNAAAGKPLLPPGVVLPNYNLDGDRGYAWSTWMLEKHSPQINPLRPTTDTDTNLRFTDWESANA